MAATTVSAIIERIESVLVAQPLSLVLVTDPFSDEGVPNNLVDGSARVESGGLVNSRDTSNYQSVRLDRVVVTVYRTLKFDAYVGQRELQDQLDEIERNVIADGPDNSYMVSVEKGSRKIVRIKDSDVIKASIAFLCDYDFDEAV